MIRLLYGAAFVVCLALAVKKAKDLSHLSLPSAEPLMFQLWANLAGLAAMLLGWYPTYAVLISVGLVVAWAGLLASAIAIVVEAMSFAKEFEKVPADLMVSAVIAGSIDVVALVIETAFAVYFVDEVLSMLGGCVL